MKSLVIYLLAGTAMLCPMNGSSEESAPSTPPPVKDPKDDFLPDMDFCSMVFQDISSKPIVWNDDRSLAVIYDETASGVLCYTFWCVKRNAQGRMVPIAKYAVWTDFPKKGILLDEKGLTVVLESTKWQKVGTTTISHYFPVNLSLIILAINAVLFVLGAVFLGKKFALTTIISSFIYPIFLSMVQSIPGIDKVTENNAMLAALYGGVLLGIGIGLVVRVGASTGGTDILALVLHKWFHVPVAVFLYIVDFSVLGLQMLFSDSEQILYGILNLFLSTVVLNRVMLLGKSQIQLFIISDKYREIRQKVLTDIDAGVTMVDIETGYGEQKQQGVLCVIHSRKLYSVKEAIQEIDPKAFITITQINEVRGRGFTMEKLRYDELNLTKN